MIDFIVTTYNRLDQLKETLASFCAHTDPAQVRKVIICNDGSDDGTAEWLKELASEKGNIKFQLQPYAKKRMGIIPRFNDALSRCKAPIVCEFQDDVRFSPGWLQRQLDYLEIADFVTGFDAPEHAAFDSFVDGAKTKKSSRFTQLMATRETWDKFFPLEPKHDFPTPCVTEDGKRVGSGIDTHLYDRRKNNPAGTVDFLCVGGIEHAAETEGSTWREEGTAPPPAQDLSTRPTPKGEQAPTVPREKPPGGLAEGEVLTYWQDRFSKQGANAIGYAGRPTEEQLRILQEKFQFIAPFVDPELRTVEYGCGIGRMSALFAPGRYCGLELTPELLQVARETYPEVPFARLVRPCQFEVMPDDRIQPFDQLFVCNVLQHNNDDGVRAFLANLADYLDGNEPFWFTLYENVAPRANCHHMNFRTVQQYRDMVAEVFGILSFESGIHTVHGQEHAAMRFKLVEGVE